MAFERPVIPYASSEPSFTPMPERGDPMSETFGGPTPWQMELRDWAISGQAVPRRMFPTAGKFDVSNVLPLAPMTPMRRFDELPSAKPPPQPGIVETLMRGVGMLFSAWAGDEHSENFGNILGNVGSIFDLPFKQVGPIPFLPGSADAREVYKKLPETELKQAYDQAIFSDPTNAALHIADYLEMHKNDIASMMGVARTTGMMFKPADSLASQLSNLIFGGLFAAGDAVARTYVGSDVRNVKETVLGVPVEELPAELAHIRSRYEAGDITYDQMLDDITTSRWRWHQDDSVAGAMLSFGLDILSDPLVVATFGVGAVKAGATGAVRSAYAATARAIEERGLRSAAELAIKNAGHEITTQRLFEWAERNAPDAVRAGVDTLSRRQKSIFRAEPVISPVYEVLDTINNPFRWFGTGKIKEAVASGLVHGHARGYAQRIGSRNIASAKGLFADQELFTRLLGVGIFNNVSVPIYVKSMASRLKNADESYRSLVGKKPVDEVRSMLDMDAGHIRMGIEATESMMERRLPKTAVGKEALESADEAFLKELSQDLSRVSGSSPAEVRAWLGSNRERWALAHHLVYTYDGIGFSSARRTVTESLNKQIAARQASGLPTDVLEKQLKVNEQLTLVSEQNLTHQRAEALMATIAAEPDQAKKAALMRQAIEQYDQLDQFADQLWEDATLVKEFDTFVNELIAKGRLVQEVDSKLIDPGVRASLANSRYIAGFAPDDPWMLVHDDAARVVGADIFVDFVDDIDPERYVTKFGLRDRGIISQFLSGIHGSLHYMKARDRFVRAGVQDLGLTAKQAKDVFEVVQREGIKQGHGPRSMTNEAAYALARDALDKVDPVAAAKLEARGLIEAMVRSWSGDLMDVGVTSKVSGIIKSAWVARTNNLVGRISEDLYPNMRFLMNPQFLSMELAEGPFFGLLRGVRLGIRRTADDIRLDSILETTYDNTVRYNDQLERMQVATADANVATMAQRDLSRLGKRGAKGTILDGPRLLHGRGGLFDYKRMLYVRDWGRRSAKAMRDNYMKYAPDVWREWEIALGTGDPQKIFMRIAEERGMYSPNKRHILHLMDAAKPRGLGRREPIRVGDIALLNGFDSTQQFRQAARDGTFTRHQFVQRYHDVGITNQAYIDDAWKVVSGFSEEEFLTAFKEVFPESVGVGDSVRTLPDGSVVREHRERFAWENHWNTHMRQAKVLGLSPEEYLNRRFNSLPSMVDEAKPIPKGALTQKMLSADELAVEEWAKYTSRRQIATVAGAEGLTLSERIERNGAALMDEWAPDLDTLWETADQLGYDVGPRSMSGPGIAIKIMRSIPSTDTELGHLAGLPASELDQVYSYLRMVHGLGEPWEGQLPGDLRPDTARLLGQKLAGIEHTMAQRYVKSLDAIDTPAGRAGATLRGTPNVSSLSAEALLAYGDAGAMRLGEAVERSIKRVLGDVEEFTPARAISYDKGRGVSVMVPDTADDAAVRDYARRLAASLQSDVALDRPVTLPAEAVNPLDTGIRRSMDLAIPAGILRHKAYREMLEKWLRTEVNNVGLEVIPTENGLRVVWDGAGTEADFISYFSGNAGEDALRKLRDGSWVDEVDQAPPVWYTDLALVLQRDTAGRLDIMDHQKEVAKFDGFAELERLRMVVWKWAGGGGDVESPRGSFERNLAGWEYDPAVIALADIIDSAPATEKTLYRGIRVADHEAHLKDYVEGGTIDFNFASFTSDPEIAESFANTAGSPGSMLFVLEGKNKGIFRNGLSGITSKEREFITQGRFRVVKVERTANGAMVHLRQEATFGSRRLEGIAIEPEYTAISREVVKNPLEGLDRPSWDAGDRPVIKPQEYELWGLRDSFHGYMDNETVGRNISHELKDYIQQYHNAPQAGSILTQRDPSGRVRAYVKLDADDRAALRVVEGRADASTAIHEAAHIFARDLDPSARAVVINEYNRATGSFITAWDRAVEEWFADEYISFAARDHAPNSRTAALFRGFHDWAAASGIGGSGSVLNDFFEKAFEGDYADIPRSFWDADAQRVWDASRTVLLRNEEAVHKTSYYSRSRNIIERSLNHPYLGLYPASYMWGKVLPELIHFLVKEPFGLSAPMGGAMLVGHVWRNVQWQLQVSEEMRQFIDQNPALINLLQMATPGTPWELPAVTPVVMRRAQERALENEVRKLQGKEPLKAAPLDWTSDMMTYAFGLTQMARRIQDIGSELAAWQRGTEGSPVPDYPWMAPSTGPLTQSLIDWERSREA